MILRVLVDRRCQLEFDEVSLQPMTDGSQSLGRFSKADLNAEMKLQRRKLGLGAHGLTNSRAGKTLAFALLSWAKTVIMWVSGSAISLGLHRATCLADLSTQQSAGNLH